MKKIKDKGLLFSLVMVIVMMNIVFLLPLFDNPSTLAVVPVILFCIAFNVVMGGSMLMIYKFTTKNPGGIV